VLEVKSSNASARTAAVRHRVQSEPRAMGAIRRWGHGPLNGTKVEPTIPLFFSMKGMSRF
jgi:hypothetical protein